MTSAGHSGSEIAPPASGSHPPDEASAAGAIAAIADAGSWRPWPASGAPLPPVDPGYLAVLHGIRARTGLDEAVLTGQLDIGGVPAAALSWEFGFLGGSVGVGTATHLVAAIRRATREGRALVSLPRSGGTRMQEGAPAFVQMVSIAAALAEHRRAGLPHLVHLGHPTTGGVLVTLGSAGDLTSAEPGALVGFLGPRAFAAITGDDFPPGVQVSENLEAAGVIDEVLELDEVRRRWVTVLRLWADGRAAAQTARAAADQPPAVVDLTGKPESSRQLWGYVSASRAAGRVGAEDFLAQQVTDWVGIPGTAAGEVAEGVRVGLGRIRDLPVVVIATVDRATGESLTAAGLRTARRGIALAVRWGLPLVTVVDTLGAQLSVEGELSGIAGEMSRTMLDLVSASTPTVALLLGAGTGGGALSLLGADRIVAASHAWVAPLAPEGAAAIRHGGDHDPAHVAWEQRIGAHALAEIGFIDTLVRESHPAWLSEAADAVVAALTEIRAGIGPDRRVARYAAWSRASQGRAAAAGAMAAGTAAGTAAAEWDGERDGVAP